MIVLKFLAFLFLCALFCLSISALFAIFGKKKKQVYDNEIDFDRP